MKWFTKDEDGMEEAPDLKPLWKSLEQANLPPHAEEAARAELDRLARTSPNTAEYTIGVNYLDYLFALPWNKRSQDTTDLAAAEAVLDAHHYHLGPVKERILEFLAVRALKARAPVRVLVVDDEKITRENLARVLSGEGMDVVTAESGEKALEQIAKADFDLVLTDIRMGRVDGRQVLRQARLKNPDTRVIVITGYATVDSAVQMMREGAFYYLAKPFKLDEVRDAVRRALSRPLAASTSRGPLLCFVGPPGTGKSSLARVIALALSRPFCRLSLGGVREEAQIRGHRRTYAGAMPGAVIQEIRRAGVNNPVFLLDEMDKVSHGYSGDPSATLLDVLDPEQNASFVDHYIEVPFDLSGVLFVATANLADTIPPPLLDRLEIVPFSSYSDKEKVHIAKKHIVPKQIKEHGLLRQAPEFSDEALFRIVTEYTNEAGLRELDRQVAAVCRKLAFEEITGGTGKAPARITEDMVPVFLGPRRYYREAIQGEDQVGVATGVFRTEEGGEIAPVEASIMKGSSRLMLTGSMGGVMEECGKTALSHLRANASEYGLDEDFFLHTDMHVHIPSAAIPKDGPSAGATMAMAMLSLLLKRPARRDAAITGELTLSGRLMPVAGVREKVLAASRAGVTTLVLPRANRADWESLPREVTRGLTPVFAAHLAQAVDAVLLPSTSP
ncbi:MAG: response regulator [Deltaproteobacteria bacterium]|nr:response regulator [Deltaproteobacteria bacterium]